MPKAKISPLEAKRFLAEIQPAWKAFWFHNGPVIRSLPQLSQVLPKVSPEMFGHHVNARKNDLADWVKCVIGDVSFAQELAKAKMQSEMSVLLEARVKELQDSLAVAPKISRKK